MTVKVNGIDHSAMKRLIIIALLLIFIISPGAVIPWCATAIVATAMIVKMRSYVVFSSRDVCPFCGYCRIGAPSLACSECGRGTDGVSPPLCFVMPPGRLAS